MTTIVFAHPWHGSFNKGILDVIEKTLTQAGRPYHIIDLNKEGFNPVMQEKELAVYQQGIMVDPKVREYNRILNETKRIVLVFPIWWYDMPAIMRGFFDKVMLEGSAFHGDAQGMHPLRSVQKSIVISTSFCSTSDLVHKFGDPVNGTIIGATFPALGFQNAEWHNFGNIESSTPAQRELFLQEIKNCFI